MVLMRPACIGRGHLPISARFAMRARMCALRSKLLSLYELGMSSSSARRSSFFDPRQHPRALLGVRIRVRISSQRALDRFQLAVDSVDAIFHVPFI